MTRRMYEVVGGMGNVRAVGAGRRAAALALLGAVLGLAVSGCTQQSAAPESDVTEAESALAPMTGVLTQHNDLARTGANLNETILNTSNVHTGSFGKLHSYPVVGQVYAQPLYVAQAISGKNVVYIATEANNVYAFDADSPWEQLWARSSIETPWMSASTCVNTQPLIGISSTPVIDPSTNTIYLTAKRNVNGTFKYMLHALNMTTGADMPGSPIDMGLDANGQPLAVNGSGDGNSSGKIVFDPIKHQNRVALTLSQGVLTVGFASHCDQNNYHGWVLRFDVTSSPIRPLTPYMTNPNTGHGGLWQGGGGFPVDGAGNLYMVSGDGRAGTTNTSGSQLANAFIKLTNVGVSGTPTVGSWFMPSDVATLDNGDVDIGSSGPMLIPGTSLLIAGGKNGILYVVNTTGDSMGHFQAGSPPDPQIVQRFSGSSSNGQIVGGPAWWESPAGPRLYVWPGGSTLGAFAFNRSTNLFNTTAVARSGDVASGGDAQGGQISVSANGSAAGTGIVWATRALGSTGGGGFNSNNPVGGALYAFDAENVATKLWDSTMVGADKLANAPKYIAPTIANGKVYVGTLGAAPSSGGEVAVYGLLNPVDGGAGGSSGSDGSTGSGGSGAVDGGTGDGGAPTLTCPTVDGGAAQPTDWTYVYNTYFAGTTTGATAGHCSECHASTLAGFACGADKDSCYAGLVSAGQVTPSSPSASPLIDPEQSPLAWFGRPTTPPGVIAFMPTDLVVRNAPAVAALCGWAQAGARDDKQNGQSCGGANECASGFCVSGTCCANATCAITPVYQLDTGSSGAVSPFSADQYFSGGTARTVTNSITITGINNPAPQAVYQSERYGNSTYTIPGLTASAPYTVRLHFAELYQTASGKRLFNVVINGTTVLSSFDIFATAGAAYKAVLREFTTNASSSGQIVINFQTITDNATIEGIEIVPVTPNAPPTIATAASANPNPVPGTSTTLSALGADDGGEGSLTYTWSTVGTPPAPVTFGANGTNAAKTTTATFSGAGTYSLQVTARDAGGLTATSTVVVTVSQTLASIGVTPASATLAPSATQQFSATARDQFGAALLVQPPYTWSVVGAGAVDANGLYTAGATAGGPYTVTAQSGSASGSASVTVVVPNGAPTIATPAAASPSPVTGSSTALSVLGADDNGEANLTYTWATTGSPPAAVTFSANGTNAAKASTATFTKAGSYALQVTVKDQGNLTVTSAVTVTVNQTLTSIAVSPASATVATSATQQFSASALDQFGLALSPQPSLIWSVSGGGTIGSSGLFTAGTSAGGPFVVAAASGSVSGTGSVTVSSTPTTVYRIDTGGSAVSPFTADQYSSGGTARTVTNSITITGITNPAPQGVYQSERYGNSTYTFPSLTPSASYTVRLHFAELYQTASGKRLFNVVINGTTVLSNFDIFATAGAAYKAVLREFTTTANASGQIVINFNTVTDNATIEGIEIVSATPNSPPAIATAASASPNPVTGASTALSVLGADDAGEANLTYTWATVGTPPAAVTFGANGTNAAKATTATFGGAGSYTLQVTARDAGGLTATSTVAVTVAQTLTSIVVAPASATIAPSGTQQFTATARDQFGGTLSPQPALTWTVTGGGTVNASGLFTAGATAGGPFTVTAQSGSVGGTASVSVVVPNGAPTIATPAAASPSPVTGTSAALSVLGADDNGEANLAYTWATTGSPPAAVTFGANGTNAAKNTTATFGKAGSYSFQVTVKDQGNLTVTSAVTVTVNQTLSSIAVSPASATVATSATQQFTASALDQFGAALGAQPSPTWSVGGGGTIGSSGLFTAGGSAGGPFTVTASSGGVNGTASVTVSSTPTTIYRIDCGGSAVSPFTADQYSSGGTARTVTNGITITGLTNPAPQGVYQSERYGNVTYTLPGLVASASYTVRLHFAELYWTSSGKRTFNVAINGTTVLSNFDLFATTGAEYKATYREFTTTANSSGQIVIQLTTVKDNATIEGIEIIRQ